MRRSLRSASCSRRLAPEPGCCTEPGRPGACAFPALPVSAALAANNMKKILFISSAVGIIVILAYSLFPVIETIFNSVDTEVINEYYVPNIEQKFPDRVVGKGTTILAKPVKTDRSSFGGLLVGKPLDIQIHPTIRHDGILQLKFIGITERVILFPESLAQDLLDSIYEFRSLKERVTTQGRKEYRQKLIELVYLEIDRSKNEIPIFFSSSAERLMKKGELRHLEGQKFFMSLHLPFALEEEENFERTEVQIPESGVEHLKSILEELLGISQPVNTTV